MCFDNFLNSSEPSIFAELQEVLDSLEFIFVLQGVILPVVVLIGIVLNGMCFVVLCKRSLRSAPYYLLRAMTVCDICILIFSIYSDVEPAVTAKIERSQMSGVLNFDCQAIRDNLRSHFLFQANLTTETGSFDADNISSFASGSENSEELDQLLLNLLFNLEPLSNDEGNTIILGDEDKITSNISDVMTTTLNKTQVTSTTVASPLGNISINTRPIVQAAERWFAYSMMTFNIGITMTLAIERWLAVTFPFRARALITPTRTLMVTGLLMSLTLGLHLPQFIKELTMALDSPEKLKDDFQGMLQSWRRPYEKFVVYLTSCVLLVTLVINVCLVHALARYKSNIKENRQPGSKISDVNVTVAIIVLVFLQIPHSIAMNVLSTMSLEGFKANMATFTRVMVTVRVLYVTNSAFNCLTYCFLSRRFRTHFISTYTGLCRRRCGICRATLDDSYRSSSPNVTSSLVVTSNINKLSTTSLNKSRSRISLASLGKSQISLSYNVVLEGPAFNRKQDRVHV